MAISLIKTLFPVVAVMKNFGVLALMAIITSLGTVMMNVTILLLMLAGLMIVSFCQSY